MKKPRSPRSARKEAAHAHKKLQRQEEHKDLKNPVSRQALMRAQKPKKAVAAGQSFWKRLKLF